VAYFLHDDVVQYEVHTVDHYAGSVTITIEVGTNGATTLSRMNFSG